jgi:hypothetical protein
MVVGGRAPREPRGLSTGHGNGVNVAVSLVFFFAVTAYDKNHCFAVGRYLGIGHPAEAEEVVEFQSLAIDICQRTLDDEGQEQKGNESNHVESAHLVLLSRHLLLLPRLRPPFNNEGSWQGKRPFRMPKTVAGRVSENL